MKNKTTILLLFFSLLATSVFSVNANANFDNNHPAYGDKFDTDLTITTSFTLSAPEDDVVSGNHNNLQSGDTVCSGATLTATPTVNAKWAVSSLSIQSVYPDCNPSYCPSMISYSTVSNNRDIRWISQAVYNEHNDYGDAGGDYVWDWNTPFAQDKYNDLSVFYNQPATYENSSGLYSNKRTGANVFCKGRFKLLDGSTVEDHVWMPASALPSFTISGAGTHSLTSSLDNVECIAVTVKHPLDQSAHPDFFYMFYFTHNQPSLGTIGSTGMNIEVLDSSSGATCTFHHTTTETSGPFVQDRMMVRTTMCNDGPGIINITDVSSNSTCHDVVPAPEDTNFCVNILGLPASMCPASNGFDEPIPVGSCTDVYVHVIRTCATGCPALTYSAESSEGGVCGGGGGTCGTDEVNLCNGTAFACEIEPPALDIGTLEVGDFGVTCYDMGNNIIPCGGNNWYWSGLSGGFVERTNTHALAYTTDPPGSSGQLWYESGLAQCYADVTTRQPWYTCEFDPPSAHVEVETSEYFNMTCYLNNTETPPDDAQYDLLDGLSGSTSNESIDGTTYDAPSNPDSGRLQGFGEYDVSQYIVGAVALANIQVVNTTGNDTNGSNGTNGGGPDGGGSPTDFCTIGGGGTLNVFPGYSGWVDIRCGPDANESCTGVMWSVDGGYYWGNTPDDGTGFTVTGPPGQWGQVFATVNSDPLQFCWLNFYIGIPDCWEFT